MYEIRNEKEALGELWHIYCAYILNLYINDEAFYAC